MSGERRRRAKSLVGQRRPEHVPLQKHFSCSCVARLNHSKIKQLTDGLDDRTIRLKAIEEIQGPIVHIIVNSKNTGFDVELHGE